MHASNYLNMWAYYVHDEEHHHQPPNEDAEEQPVRRLERGSADTAPRVIAIALKWMVYSLK